MVYNGKFQENGWSGGTPISGNLHIHIHIHIHIYIYIYIYRYIYISTYIDIYIYICIYIYVYIYVYIYICIYIDMYTYIYMYTYMYIYIAMNIWFWSTFKDDFPSEQTFIYGISRPNNTSILSSLRSKNHQTHIFLCSNNHIFMIFPWYPYDLSDIFMIFPWFSQDIPMFFSPMVFRCVSHVFPMIFPGFQRNLSSASPAPALRPAAACCVRWARPCDGGRPPPWVHGTVCCFY